jgi:hypothetical protein
MISERTTLACFWTLYVLTALFVMVTFVPGSGYLTDNSHEEVAPPVAYRVLVPAMTKGIYAMVPASVEEAMTPYLVSLRETSVFARLMQFDRWPALPRTFQDGALLMTLIKLMVVFGWLLAFIYMLSRLTAAFFPASRACALLAPLLFLWLLPAFLHRYAYTYDFAELFFSCACFYLLYKQRWNAYLFCFALATLNKETSGFIIFFFAIWFLPRLPQQRYLTLLCAQILLFVIIETMIISSFAHVPGSHGGTGIDYYINTFLRHMRHAFGYNYYSYVCAVITGFLLLYKWQEKPAFLLAGLLMAIPNLAAYFLTCNVAEYRDLFWCMPVPVILATHSIVKLLELDDVPLFKQRES